MSKTRIPHFSRSDIVHIVIEFASAAVFASGSNLKGFAPFGAGLLLAAASAGYMPFISLCGILSVSLILGDHGQACASLLFVLLLILCAIFGRKPTVGGKRILFVFSQAAVFPIFNGFYLSSFLCMGTSIIFSLLFSVCAGHIQTAANGMKRHFIPSFDIRTVFFAAAVLYCAVRAAFFSVWAMAAILSLAVFCSVRCALLFFRRRAIKTEAELLLLKERLTRTAGVICASADIFSHSENGEAQLASRLFHASGELILKAVGTNRVYKKRYSARVGACACPKAGNEETGDSIAIREYGHHMLFALSDGMGSGKAAHRESLTAVTLLSDLLSAGFEMSDALECVNMLMLRRSENDMYATVDAVELDLHSLRAKFIKHSAVNSYIVRGSEVITVSADSLPVGIIEKARAAMCSMRLYRGDVIFLMSDGVSEALDTRLVDALLDACAYLDDPNLIADEILYTARRISDRDDMTVITVKTA